MSSARLYSDPVAPHNSLGLQTIPRPEAQNTEQIVIVAMPESIKYVKFRELDRFTFAKKIEISLIDRIFAVFWRVF